MTREYTKEDIEQAEVMGRVLAALESLAKNIDALREDILDIKKTKVSKSEMASWDKKWTKELDAFDEWKDNEYGPVKKKVETIYTRALAIAGAVGILIAAINQVYDYLK